MARRAGLSPSERAWVVAIIAAAALLRLWLNNLSQFSPADEQVYVDLSRRLADGGFFSTYAAVASDWMNDRSWWIYPNPLRCGYLALTTLSVRLYGAADPRALAWLSTIAGIAVLPLLFATARRLGGPRAAILATVFVAVSPIQLALGRRALQDEVLCAATLLAFAAVVHLLEDRSPSYRPLILAVAALTFALSIKETFLFLFPALAAFVVLYPGRSRLGVRHAALLIAPPLLWWSVLTALTQDATMLFRTARLVGGAMAARYVVQYQSGPPHRLLFDFVAAAPFISVLACAAIVVLLVDGKSDARLGAAAMFVLLGMATFSVVASKNLRFIVMLDPFVRLLAASIVVLPRPGVETRVSAVVAIALANVTIELELFRALFITGGVYDPVTHTMLEALGAVPRDATPAPAAMLWPWICGAIAVGWCLWSRTHFHHAAEKAPVPSPLRGEG
jgi:4-amino-4-deoxy-L-arabinose transferase-like glycosyltransferase